jgi:hypothetical protein
MPNEFSSPYFELDTVELPTIKYGGASSSEVLNRFLRSLYRDSVRLGGALASEQFRSARLASAIAAQAAGFATQWSTLANTVSAMASSGQIIRIDAHREAFLNNADSNMSQSLIYGQITLPIRSSEDLLFTSDVYGSPWVASDTQLLYYETDQVAVEPGDDFYLNDPTTRIVLSNQGIWLSAGNSNIYKWVKLEAPIQLQGQPPTCIEIDPLPSYGLDLLSADVRTFNAAGWQSLDLSYMPGWDGTKVSQAGPMRLFFDTDDVRSVRFKFKALSTSAAWGCASVRLKHLEFESQGRVRWDVAGQKSVLIARLEGKDPSSLSELLTDYRNQNYYIVSLSSEDSQSSPVITGAILRLN